jgi:hypothetical protein
MSLCALGCSSSGPSESDKAPSDQCQDYETAYCAKAVDCAASTDRADFGETCDFSFRVYLPCSSVTFVATDSQPCLNALGAISCSTVEPGSFPTTPYACQMLFGTN